MSGNLFDLWKRLRFDEVSKKSEKCLMRTRLEENLVGKLKCRFFSFRETQEKLINKFKTFHQKLLKFF
jgi:hypothetical protein